MFGIDDGILGSLVSSGIGFLGQNSTNSANAAIAQANNEFNAEQAALNRTFQSDQSQRQMDFQRQQVQTVADWETNMSNTAYQRAMNDMQAAGLNPMLAAHLGGAGTPSVSPGSGSMASGSTASSAGLPRFESSAGAAIRAASDYQQTRKAMQDVKIREPLEKGSAAVSDGIDVVKDAIKPAAEGVSALVGKIQDQIESGAVSSAGAAAVEAVKGAVSDLANMVSRAIRNSPPARAVQSAVHSAGDAIEAVKRGGAALVEGAKRGSELMSSPQETARERAKRIGRRLGTHGADSVIQSYTGRDPTR